MRRITNKRTGLVLLAVTAALVAVMLYGRVSVAAQPGDSTDPLVSKAYVDGQINQLKALLSALSGVDTAPSSTDAGLNSADMQTVRDAVTAEVLAYIETVYGEQLRSAAQETPPAQPPQDESASEQSMFIVVRADAGQTIIGRAGTEIILRSGAAVAVSGINGLCDVTEGADITNGMRVKTNHLLIVPADDGRGLRLSTEAYLMVKGGYYFAY